jgi:predicted nuclease with TOPRIM domain
MLQMSKIIRSRDDWKRKAVEQANENRELRKTKKHHQDKIAELKTQIKTMAEDKKKSINPPRY